MDRSVYRIAFSVFEDNTGVPLPVVMASPLVDYIDNHTANNWASVLCADTDLCLK